MRPLPPAHAARDRLAAQNRAAVVAQFAATRQAVCAAITSAGDPDQAQQAAQQAHDRQRHAWAVLLVALVTGAATAASAAVRQSLEAAGVTGMDMPGTSAAEWAAANQDDLAGWVQDHTGDMLTEVLTAGIAHGMDLAGLVDAVSALFDQWIGQTGAGDFAEQIAGDLTRQGWGMGEFDGILNLLDQGYSCAKTWNTMGDDRVRATHDDVDGMTIDAQDSFTVGGESLDYPGDPQGSLSETSGCRCWLEWVITGTPTEAQAAIMESEGD
ncbi:MAG: hypothetical protein KGH75_00795 [Rhodospirillales bacterium]|nr:hypothetical protein [Rhodospirillales bacterium]